MEKFEYGQTALTFTVKLNRPDQSQQQSRLSKRAFQRFLPTGPLALLPTWSDEHGVVVWSTTPTEVQRWNAVAAASSSDDPAALVAHLNALLQTGPEQLPALFSPLAAASEQQQHFAPLPSLLLSNLLYGIEKVIDTVQYASAMATQQQQSELLSNENGRVGAAAAVYQAPPLIQEIVSPQFVFP